MSRSPRPEGPGGRVWATAPASEAEAGRGGRDALWLSLRRHIQNMSPLLFSTLTHCFKALHLGKTHLVLTSCLRGPGRCTGLSADVLPSPDAPTNCLGGPCCPGGCEGPGLSLRAPTWGTSLLQVEACAGGRGLQGGLSTFRPFQPSRAWCHIWS